MGFASWVHSGICTSDGSRLFKAYSILLFSLRSWFTSSFGFFITMEEILAIRGWCALGFCSDVSGCVVHSCSFPALDDTHIQEHLSLSRISQGSLGEVWLCLLPAERRGRGGEVGVGSTQGP